MRFYYTLTVTSNYSVASLRTEKVLCFMNPIDFIQSLYARNFAPPPVFNSSYQKPPSRTATKAIDYSKAFDSINHRTLLNKLCNCQLHPNIICWLTCYLRGRATTCHYKSAISRKRINHSGVPQGAVLSPSLYNFFTADCPTPAKINSSYPDDVTKVDSGPDKTHDVSKLSTTLNNRTTSQKLLQNHQWFFPPPPLSKQTKSHPQFSWKTPYCH